MQTCMVRMATVRVLNLVSVIVCVLVFCPCSVTSDDTVPIPQQKSQVESWFNANVQPLASRKGLDPALVKAEGAVQHIKVGKGGQFKTIQQAVDSIPKKNTKRYILNIAGGTYNERVKIDADKPFVTFYGDPKSRPLIVAAGTAAQFGTVFSATLYVESDYFMAVNIDVKNSAPRPDGVRKGAQAVALTQNGDKAAFYGVKLYGFQDTFCDDKGRHFFKNSYIEGTVDFVFGNGKTLYVDTELHVIQGNNMAVIAAQARHTNAEDTGYSFAQCKVTGKGAALLGRGWKPFSRVVYAYSEICDAIKPEGWQEGMGAKLHSGGTIYFGEFKNTGPGAKLDARPKFVKRMTEAEVKPFISLSFIEASKWLLPPIKAA